MKKGKVCMDSKEALAQKIFECADREYSAFIEEMKKHDPDYLVDHAYEIFIMSNLHMIFEEDELSLPALQEIDKLERPLASIYDEWLKNDCGYMEQLRKTVVSFHGKAAARNSATILCRSVNTEIHQRIS